MSRQVCYGGVRLLGEGPSSIRPLFPYYGSKWNVARYYPAPSGRAIEPFAGGAGYSLYYGCETVLLADADPIISGLWAYLITVTADEILALPELPEVGDSVDNYNIRQEAKWLIGFWLNRGSAQPKKSRTAYSARTDKAQLNWGPRAKERIASQLDRIRGWRVLDCSYSGVPNFLGTWFIDPPYGDKGRYYKVNLTPSTELGDWCRTRRGRVIVCEGLGADWLPFQPLGNFKSSKGKAFEVVYIQ